MSTWDEMAEDYAVAHHTYEHLDDSENALHTSGVVRGARWQRKALLTDEAVERAARALFDHDRDHDVIAGWCTTSTSVQSEYLAMARVALTAAIGASDGPV